MGSKPYKCVLFDVDGTILDTISASVSAAKSALFDVTGKQYDHEELAFAFGLPIGESAKILGIKDIPAFEKLNQDYYKKYSAAQISIFPGVEELIKTLHGKKIPLGVITSKERWEYDFDFALFGLARYFTRSMCVEDTARHKPDPQPILKFFELTGLDINESIYIGDTKYDIQCAAAAGIDFGCAAWSGKTLEGAKYTFKKPSDVLSLV